MSILEKEFQEGCEKLSHVWQTSKHCQDWQSCRILELSGTRWLRVQRFLLHQQSDLHVDNEDEVSEKDDDMLESVPHLDRSVCIQYDIVYSQTYQVPVLYLSITGQSQGRKPSLEDIYGFVTHSSNEAQLRNVGVLGALSLVDHPIYGKPVYMVHPCRTQEAMHEVLAGVRASPQQYLLLWFGLIGNQVGLSIPPTLVLSLQQQQPAE